MRLLRSEEGELGDDEGGRESLVVVVGGRGWIGDSNNTRRV